MGGTHGGGDPIDPGDRTGPEDSASGGPRHGWRRGLVGTDEALRDAEDRSEANDAG